MSGGFSGMLKDLEQQRLDKLYSKLPSWAGRDIIVPESLNLEQCSSETAARYKASLAGRGLRIADLTGGLGADSWAFSLDSEAVWYNERDAALYSAALKNFAALDAANVYFNNFDISSEDAGWVESLRAFRPDLIYLDPARRNVSGRKVFLLEECSPDAVSLMPQLLDIAPLVMVKVSPMADLVMLQRRLGQYLETIFVIGVKGECKELLCMCGRDASFLGVSLAEDGLPFDRSLTEPGEGSLLFVPSAALTKSGLGPGLCLCAYNEHLSHFGKFYSVIEDLPFASSEIKALGKRYQQAEVTARAVRLSSEDLRRRLGVRPGGNIHIFACVIGGQRRLLVCSRS